MQALEIERKLIKITAVQPVAEFKGDQKDHGVSVTFERNFDNSILDEFEPGMLTTLYKEEDGEPKTDASGHGELTMPLPGLKLTARKNLWIPATLKLRKILEGWQIIYHRGASPQSDIKALDVRLCDFQLIEACEGGSVLLKYRAYQKLPPELQGYVDHMASTEVECTFRAPEQAQTDLVDQAQSKGRSRKKTAAEKIAESGDPLAGSDLAQDHTRIESTDAGEQASRDGSEWPFPSPGAAQH